MWKHHMTSPNFGENFKCIYQIVVVQKEALKLMRTYFKGIKLRKNNYANKPTDKRNVFLARVYKSNNIFGRFSLGVKTPQY